MSRASFKATAAMRKSVELMKADGWSDERIAAQLGCSRPTLLKHFANELEFGADKVRREQLANLAKASRKGNVAAAKALLARADVMPGGVSRTQSQADPDEPKSTPLGKKEQANLEAQNAAEGTTWATLIKH